MTQTVAVKVGGSLVIGKRKYTLYPAATHWLHNISTNTDHSIQNKSKSPAMEKRKQSVILWQH